MLTQIEPMGTLRFQIQVMGPLMFLFLSKFCCKVHDVVKMIFSIFFVTTFFLQIRFGVCCLKAILLLIDPLKFKSAILNLGTQSV
jgi:hypothetical protein